MIRPGNAHTRSTGSFAGSGTTYTLHATIDHADTYTKELVYEDHSETYKAGIQKAIKTLFKYLNHEKGRKIDWEPEIKFTNGGSQTHQVRDFLTEDERRQIK